MFSREIHPEGLEKSHPPQWHHAQVWNSQTHSDLLLGYIGYKPSSLPFIDKILVRFIVCVLKKQTSFKKIQFITHFQDTPCV